MEPERQTFDRESPQSPRKPLFRKWLIFTLLGLLVTACFIGICVPRLNPPDRDDTRIPDTIGDLANIATAIELFHTDTKRYPTTAEGLEALVSHPQDTAGWNGPYVEKVFQDAWGHPYIYRCPGTQYPNTFDLISSGPDGIEGTADDLTKDSK